MDFFISFVLVAILAPFAQSKVILRPVSNINIPSTYSLANDGSIGRLFGVDEASVEQSAYDAETGLVYVAGDRFIHVVDYSDVNNPSLVHFLPSRAINDVEQCGNLVAFALAGANPDQRGEIRVFNVYDQVNDIFEMAYPPFRVGYNPDMLHFSHDCQTIVTADEAEPYEDPSLGLVDPEGSVSIIRLNGTSPTLKTLDFTAFNDRAGAYLANGVRQNYKGELGRTPSTFSQTLEPEYVTFNTDETKAYIGLQESNAIAEVNLLTDTIDEIYPLGVKSWKDLGLDASDKDDKINLANYDIQSLYQPDAIKFFESNGKGYIITGNEGETASYEANGNEYDDSKRGKKMLEQGLFSADLDPALLQALGDNSKLGRLSFSTVDGFSASDPTKIDKPTFFGGRGISIYQADDMKQVWDSGDQISRKHAELYPDTFNANSKPDDPGRETPGDLFDKRSDNHGPEAEALAIGQLDDNTRLVFVGTGRTSSIAVYKLDEPTTAGATPALEFESMYRAGGVDRSFSALLEDKDIGNLDPEDLKFVPAAKSPTGNPLLLVSGATSGNLVMYEVVDDGNGGGGTRPRTKKCRKNKWATCNEPALAPRRPRMRKRALF